MPKGVARGINGPMKGTKYVKAKSLIGLPADIKRAARQSGVTPLDYMLAVMNDVTAEEIRRDRMAMAAAPYVHPKVSDVAPGKKEQATVKARTAHEETGWERLINAGH